MISIFLYYFVYNKTLFGIDRQIIIFANGQSKVQYTRNLQLYIYYTLYNLTIHFLKILLILKILTVRLEVYYFCKNTNLKFDLGEQKKTDIDPNIFL